MRKIPGLRAIFLLALSGGAPSAHAQHMNAADAPCRDIAQTYALATCLAAAEKQADLQRESTYRQIADAVTDQTRMELGRTERAWTAYRDAFCDTEYHSFSGGSGGPPARLACMEALTRHHIADLQAAFHWRVEKFGKTAPANTP
ncbi:lysozyme inhibitor LprI family protein [Gluconacetobacter sp. Hr-1-5]|uniref:lysozyme inhibitor LprI family protein n=1 Tax=Gluconacetobacter sp. Hr-1-5 TaxID=3395370 RepID=UPI003B51FC6A